VGEIEEMKNYFSAVSGQRSAVSLNAKYGFTLIELLISIVITLFIAAAIYWSIVTALQSWAYVKDELVLQKVLSGVMQELVEGTPETYGLRDALEVVKAYNDEVEIVFPWTDDTHMVQSGLNIYNLNKGIKPGTSIPIGEARPPDTDTYYAVPITMLDWGKKEELNNVQLLLQVAPGSLLRFTYHPDAGKDPDVITRFRWIKDDGRIYVENSAGIKAISKNPFGVKITKFLLRYYDNANNDISKGTDVDEADLQFISGIEIFLEAGYKGKNKELLSFVSLRNSPARGGSVNLREGMRMPIPDSRKIKILFLTNLIGIDDRDVIQIEAAPKSGKDWRLTIIFGRDGLSVPIIESYTIDYPTGQAAFTDKPRTSVALGLNLLSLGPNGLYDYDKDEEAEDFVLLEGEVELKIVKMDIAGAALFIK
jgi:prepilin-type N-terminal cleavage/methylation domain-containing protein